MTEGKEATSPAESSMGWGRNQGARNLFICFSGRLPACLAVIATVTAPDLYSGTYSRAVDTLLPLSLNECMGLASCSSQALSYPPDLWDQNPCHEITQSHLPSG